MSRRVDWIASSNTTHGTYVRSSGVWAVGNLAPSESAFLFISVIAPEALVPTTNYAEVSASDQDDPDSTPGNASTTEDDDASVIVTPELGTADLSLTMSVSNPHPNLGQNVQIRLTVRNDGPDRARNVTVALVLPPGLDFFSASSSEYDGLGEWTVGDLSASPASRERTLLVDATVNTTSALVPHAEVETSDQADPDSTPGNASTTEDDDASVTIAADSPSADLSLTMSVDDPTPYVGDNVTFTLTLVNGGPQTVSSARVEYGVTSRPEVRFGQRRWRLFPVPSPVWVHGGFFICLPRAPAIHHITAKSDQRGTWRHRRRGRLLEPPGPGRHADDDIPPEDDHARFTVTGQPIADLSLTNIGTTPRRPLAAP